MGKILRARAPAKLILSGEHSVVYGLPAIALAINKYTETEVSWAKTSAFLFNMLNLETVSKMTISTLKKLRRRISEDYHSFLSGKCSIKEVVKKPFELIQFTVTNVLEDLNINLPSGLEIKVKSSIPIGCGLGSSSALVISTIYAVIKLLGVELDYSKFINMSKQAENIQHGKSSGLDLHLSAFGGIKKYQSGKTSDLIVDNLPFYIINTGSPQASTGECVDFVKDKFSDQILLDDFETTTQIIESALLDNDINNLKDGIKANHKLLCHIGTVPEKIKSFISDIEYIDGASKVCGAGSIYGDSAGAVIVIGEKERLQKIADQYNYKLENVELDLRGAHLV